jgi:hypothetical protein
LSELFKDIHPWVRVGLLILMACLIVPGVVIAVPAFLRAVDQGRSITLIPPQIGEHNDPSVKKCAEVVGNTNAATQAFSAEIGRLSDLLTKQQAEFATALEHIEKSDSGAGGNWVRAANRLETEMSDTKEQLPVKLEAAGFPGLAPARPERATRRIRAANAGR